MSPLAFSAVLEPSVLDILIELFTHLVSRKNRHPAPAFEKPSPEAVNRNCALSGKAEWLPISPPRSCGSSSSCRRGSVEHGNQLEPFPPVLCSIVVEYCPVWNRRWDLFLHPSSLEAVVGFSRLICFKLWYRGIFHNPMCSSKNSHGRKGCWLE